ncbi:MAG: ATP-binding cassette domain-containing protein [Gammaproteobacteria bacterium]|jgi:thiamine transport system ATP-binding protein|nr:ATP-binding cassette domain-containing protein [Gammaproteobacteria bacterium]
MLELKQLQVRQGQNQFCFAATLAQQTCTALVGASGAGKTTLLNLLAGFVTPDAGQLLWQGQDLLPLKPAHRPFTSLFQEHNLFSHLDLFTNVGLGIDPGLRLTTSQRQEVDEALAQVGLAGMGERLPGSLSGGQRQRAALARALVRRQPWLLLDEPFSALDPGLRQEMIVLLGDLQKRNKLSLLLVTHDPQEALQLASEVIFIAEGGVYWQGQGNEFLQQKSEPIQRYLGHAASVSQGF